MREGRFRIGRDLLFRVAKHESPIPDSPDIDANQELKHEHD